MRLAFYAPLKPPDHCVPSGDRRVAQLLMQALRLAGHEVELAARLRSRDGTGDRSRQARLGALGRCLADRLVRRWRAQPPDQWPQAWFTYHLYYKAPDWIGPVVCDALAIPYAVAEASFAPKRAGGPWQIGHAGVAAALRRADLVVGLNSADRACVEPVMRTDARYLGFRPFLDGLPYRAARSDRQALAARHDLPAGAVWLLCAAMMRPGAKRRSYRLLAEALGTLKIDIDWRLIVVGDGPERGPIEADFSAMAERVRFIGRLEPAALASWYKSADVFAWPAIDEAYGMAILEAQAAGLPVVAGASGGVGDIVRHNHTGLLAPAGDGVAFGHAVARILAEPATRQSMATAAVETVMARHDLSAAAATIGTALEQVRHAGRL